MASIEALIAKETTSKAHIQVHTNKESREKQPGGSRGRNGLRPVGLGEGPKRRIRDGGGSEWEPMKILFKNSSYEPDFTRAPPQASLAKFTQPLKCYWT
jgi:hypothetical protein